MPVMRSVASLFRLATLMLALGAALPTQPAAAQQRFDPRPTLAMLIQAFQNCGPPAAYQSLSPNLWMIVAQQTGGYGCYQQIRGAGPLTQMTVTDTKQFPLGPVYVVRVTHSIAGSVDWFVGFNQATGKVEYLSFQNVTTGPGPTIAQGPDAAKTLGGIAPQPQPQPQPAPTSTATPEGREDPRVLAMKRSCEKFPPMCPRR